MWQKNFADVIKLMMRVRRLLPYLDGLLRVITSIFVKKNLRELTTEKAE